QAGLQQLPAPVRKAHTRGCVELDADALHLAIMAQVWDIPELQELLVTRGAPTVWRVLVDHVATQIHGRALQANPLSHEERKAYKAAIHHGVYALGYGGGKKQIAQQIKAHAPSGLFEDYPAVVTAMRSLPCLGAVFEAKERMLKQIAEA